jgi:hypothetical protein
MELPKFMIWQPKRSARQEAALKSAKRYYDSNPEKYKNTMFCPYCGEPLIKSGIQRRFETLTEHVGNPNGTPSLKDELVCSAKGLFNHQYLAEENNPEMNMIGCEFGILHVWNDDPYGGIEAGGSYISEYRSKLWELSKRDIISKRVIGEWLREDNSLDFTAALNSFECESQTSISKTGLIKEKYLFPFSWRYNILIKFDYSSNRFGEVTGISITTKLVRITNRRGHCYSRKEIDPISTWVFLNKTANLELEGSKRFKDFEPGYYHRIHEALKDPFNDGWIYRLHAKWMRFKHPKLTKKLVEKYGKDVFTKSYL